MKRVRTACFAAAGLLVAGLSLAALRGLHPWNGEFRARLAAGEDWLHDDFLVAGFWIGGAISVLVAAALGMTASRWARPAVPVLPVPSPATAGRPAFLTVAVVAVGIFSCFAAPRLQHSFWDDEQHTLLDFVHGQWFREVDDSGRVRQYFGQPSWWDTTFGYRDPNNHLLFSIAARGCLAAWRLRGGHEPWEFSETAFRLPAFVAAILAIPAWGFLARRLGMRGGALLLMLLLSLHPWFVRYGSEGRGYAFVLLLLPLHLAATLAAFRTGRWRFWAAAALLQILLLYSWPGIALPLAALHLAWLCLLWKSSRRPNEDGASPGHGLRQWLVANLAAGSVAAILLAPCLLQSAFTDFEYAKGRMDARYLANFLTHLTTGQVWFGSKNGMPLAETFLPLGAQPWPGRLSTVLFIALLVLFAALGLRPLFERNKPPCAVPRSAVIALAAAVFAVIAPALWFPGLFKGTHLFDWYFLWFLPVFLLLVCHGAMTLTGRMKPAVLGATLIAAAGHGLPHLQRLRDFPVQPMRESVALMRQRTDFATADAASVFTAHINQMATIYDPHCYEVTDLRTDDPADPGLENLMAAADRGAKPLLVNVGLPFAARLNYPELMNLIDQPQLFEQIAVTRGQELGIDHVIYRYRGGRFSGPKP